MRAQSLTGRARSAEKSLAAHRLEVSHGIAAIALSRRGMLALASARPLRGRLRHASPQANLEGGKRAYLDGRKSDAELIWLQSLAEAEAVGENDPRLTQSLRMLSNLQIQQQRYDEAKPLLERWMDIKERRGETNDPEFADGVDALAGIHMVQGRFEQAALLYERSVEVRENDGMIDNVELAESLERLASAYEALGRSDEAAPLFERSLAIREQVYGSDDPGLAKSLHGLAVIQHENGNYREAEQLYERALDLVERDRRARRSVRGRAAHESRHPLPLARPPGRRARPSSRRRAACARS